VVEVELVEPGVSVNARQGGFQDENPSHVVQLHVRESLLIVLGPSTEQVVEVVSQRELGSMKDHEIIAGHHPPFVLLLVLLDKDFLENLYNSI